MEIDFQDFMRYVWVPMFAYIMWEYRTFKTNTDHHTRQLRDRIVKLESEAVTEERLRSIVKELFTPFHADHQELKLSIKSIQDGLVELKVNIAESRNVHS